MMIIEGSSIDRDDDADAILHPGDMVELFAMEGLDADVSPFLLGYDHLGWLNDCIRLSSPIVLVIGAHETVRMDRGISSIPLRPFDRERSRTCYTMARCMGTHVDGSPAVGWAHLNNAWIAKVFRPW